jgi:hypothetical protein
MKTHLQLGMDNFQRIRIEIIELRKKQRFEKNKKRHKSNVKKQDIKNAKENLERWSK